MEPKVCAQANNIWLLCAALLLLRGPFSVPAASSDVEASTGRGSSRRQQSQHPTTARYNVRPGAMADAQQGEILSQHIKYPSARRVETQVETIFNYSVADPYRWLEDPESEETRAFVDAQNAVSRAFYITPFRQKYFQSLKEAYSYPKQGVPVRHGNQWVTWYNAGLQNQDVLQLRDSPRLDTQPRVLLDPNTWTEDGTASVRDVAFTEDGTLLAYTRSDKGSDWAKIYFVKVEEILHLPDVLERVKFTSLAWAPDKSGIFYSRYDVENVELEAGKENTKLEFHKVYFHRLGTKQEDDILIVHHTEEPNWISAVEVSWDQRYLILTVSKDCTPVNQVRIADMEEAKQPPVKRLVDGSPLYDFSQLKWKPVVTDFEASYEYVTNDANLFYFLSNKDASRYNVLTYELDAPNPEKAWHVHVREEPNLLECAEVVDGNKLVLQYLVDVTAALYIRDLSCGTLLGEIALQPGTVRGLSGERKFSHLYFKYESYSTPAVIYSASLQTPAKDGKWKPMPVYTTCVNGLDLSKISVEKHFYKGKDGQKIPLFLVHSKDVALTPRTPTILYGYGGVSVALAALHAGMTYAVPNIRGGGEYGKEWYEAAIKTKKQVSLDDFQQAAEYLIQQNYTSADKLAIRGGSNGGFLVAACANQRPDLFKAAIIQVGVLDLTRFDQFTIGSAWRSDYGDPKIEKEFNAIMKVSPLHNIRKRPGIQYPAVLLTTADHDDRVAPLHSLKFIAQLQHVFKDDPRQGNPLLIRVETKAGHGAGKSTTQLLEEEADVFGFLARVLDLTWHE